MERYFTGTRTPAARQLVLTGLLCVIAITLFYHSLWWNHFLAARAGHYAIVGGQLILEGKVPHRDFFLPTTPLQILKAAFLSYWFGMSLTVPLVVAVFERALMAGLLYCWLVRFFKVSHSVVASVAAIVLSSGDFAEFLTSYNHAAILFAIAAGYAASYVIDECPAKWFSVLSVLCGSLMGLCFATKQTIGGGLTIIVVVVVGVVLLRLTGLKRALSFIALYSFGWLLPVGAMWIWFYENGVLARHFDQIFFSGVGGKGSPLQVLLRPIIIPLRVGAIRILLFIALGTIVSWKLFTRKTVPRPFDGAERIGTTLATAGMALAAIVAGMAASYLVAEPSDWLQVLLRSTIYTTLLVHLATTLSATENGLFFGLTRGEAQSWLCSAVSLGTCLTLTISAPAFEAMLLPGFGFLAAGALLYVGHVRWKENLILALLGFVLLSQTLLKLQAPFGWQFWADGPVRTATVTSTLPELSGFRLPSETNEIVDGATLAIREHSSPGQTMYTYPFLPIFYVLSGLKPVTYSLEHLIDVAPDDIAIRDAKTLLVERPHILVYFELPPEYLESAELVWRFGARSGQRDIIHAIEELSADYTEIGRFDVPGSVATLKIWARRD